MKTIYIVRHAKSSWDYPELGDDERPLIEKGRKRTKKVINHLLNKNIKLDCIISSHAVRALDTAKIFAKALDYPVDKIMIKPEVYHGSADSLFSQFFGLPDSYNSAMIVGHNPPITSFANMFVKPYIDWVPTSGLICVRFKTDDWSNIPLAAYKVDFLLFPKDLKAAK